MPVCQSLGAGRPGRASVCSVYVLPEALTGVDARQCDIQLILNLSAYLYSNDSICTSREFGPTKT